MSSQNLSATAFLEDTPTFYIPYICENMDVADGLAKLSDLVLVDYDFDWAANEKESIIEHFNDIMVD